MCLLCALAVGPAKVSDDHVVVASLHDTSPDTLTTRAETLTIDISLTCFPFLFLAAIPLSHTVYFT